MTTHEINLLIERYLDGTTTPAEERELALAVQQPDAPPEWAIIAEMLGELTTDAALYDNIMAQRAPQPAKQDATPAKQDATPAKRFVRLWPWAAAACVAVALGLSYNYIHRATPQEIAHTEPPQLPPKAKQAEAPTPLEASEATADAPLIAAAETEEPPLPEPPREASEATTDAPLIAAAETEEPPFLEPPREATDSSITDTPDTPDTRLYLALLAEVEARAFQIEQSEQRLYQPLLDEILANIQQQSNRPELSL